MVESFIDTSKPSFISKQLLSTEVETAYYELELQDTFYNRVQFDNRPANMTPEDKVVWKILKTAKPEVERKLGRKIELEESSDDDENISQYEFVNNFLKYQTSFKKFRVSAEEIFNILHYRTMLQELATQKPIEEPAEETKTTGIDCISYLPVELKVLLLRFTGPKGYFKGLRINQAWRQTLLSTQSEHRRKTFN
jgi:hypothetical protein